MNTRTQQDDCFWPSSSAPLRAWPPRSLLPEASCAPQRKSLTTVLLLVEGVARLVHGSEWDTGSDLDERLN